MSNSVPQVRSQKPMRSPFDEIRREEVLPSGEVIEFWSAREAMPHLGYANWQNFEKVVSKARSACRNAGHNVADHFIDASNLIPTGKGAMRPTADVQLTRFAMYLLAMNGDPDKSEIAAAQRYFVVQTRRAELELPPVTTLPAVVLTPPAAQPRPWAIRFRETFGDHYRHVHLNHPAGSFSVVTAGLMQMLMLEDQLIRHAMEVQSGDRPCISIGRTWSNWRKEQKLGDALGDSPLYLPDQGFEVPVYVYGSEERVQFDVWLHNIYLPQKLLPYLERKKEFKEVPQLPKDSVANNACLELTGRPATAIPAPRLRALEAAGGFVASPRPLLARHQATLPDAGA
jgi:hypothetical protein